jgi:hypothetical protein
VKTSIATLFAKDFFFPDIDYTSSTPIAEDARPSSNIYVLLNSLQDIVSNLDPSLARGKIMSRIVEGLFELMTQDRCWGNDIGPRKFGFGGVHQVVLDVHFCLHVFDGFLSEQSSLQANGICVRALRAYFDGGDGRDVRGGEWYEARVLDVAGNGREWDVLMGVVL